MCWCKYWQLSSSLFLSYEIQMESEARGKGLGKFLMLILEMIAHRLVLVVLICYYK